MIRAVGIAMLILVGPAFAADCAAPTTLPWRVADTRSIPASLYVQGFEIGTDGHWWLSGGGYGESHLIRQHDERTLARHDLPARRFAEGLSLQGESLWLLTWQAGEALVFDAQTLSLQRTLRYAGEGWGLAWAAEREQFLMSNGSATLVWRSAADFSVLDRLQVRRGDRPQTRLNELELVPGAVWANIWYQDEIVRIDLASGCVDAVLDLRRLWPAAQRPREAEVLNGIAHDPQTGWLWVTGKRWGRAFALELD